MKKHYKIFEGETVQEAFNKMLDEGYEPAFKTLKEAWKWKQENSPNDWVDIGFYFLRGKIKRLTLDQCRNLNNLFEQGGRLVFMGYAVLHSGNYINNSGRCVGVRIIKENKKGVETR